MDTEKITEPENGEKELHQAAPAEGSGQGGDAAEDISILNEDSTYRKGTKLYRAGLIMLLVFVIINIVFEFTGIKLVIANAILNSYFYLLYLVPLIMMSMGLYKSYKAAKLKKSKREKSHSVYFLFSFALTLMFAVFAAVTVIQNPYTDAVFTEEQLSDGDTVTVVDSNVSAHTLFSAADVGVVHNIEVFRKSGIFMMPVCSATSDSVNYSYYISESENGKNKYALSVTNGMAVLVVPFD